MDAKPGDPNYFQSLYACYVTGQMSEAAWQDHLRNDEGLRKWVARYGRSVAAIR